MGNYLLKRIVLVFPTLLGAICIVFILIQCIPGGPIDHFLAETYYGSEGERGGNGESFFSKGKLDPQSVETLKKRFDFDKPLWKRFLTEITRLLTFQFGDSYFYQKSVWELIKEKFPVSFSLGIISFLVTYFLCIPLGILRAWKNGTVFESVTGVFVLMGYAIPSFVVGIMLIVLFGGGSFWQIFPIRGLVSENFADLSLWEKLTDYASHLFLPAICVSVGTLAFMSNLTKNLVLEHMTLDYVKMAKLKGLSDIQVIVKHVIKNIAIPLVTGFGNRFLKIFFASSLLVETLFSLDGIGLLSYESILHRDYPVVMANFYIFTLILILGNLISDILYAVLDPRLSF